MKYKSKEHRDQDRRLAAYDERIEAAKLRLIKALDGPDSAMYVACNSVTYEPVCVSSTGMILTSISGNIKLHSSREEAASTAVKAHNKSSDHVFVVMRLSSSLNFHIEWLKSRKDVAVRLYSAMLSKRRVASQRELVGKGKSPWWNKV